MLFTENWVKPHATTFRNKQRWKDKIIVFLICGTLNLCIYIKLCKWYAFSYCFTENVNFSYVNRDTLPTEQQCDTLYVEKNVFYWYKTLNCCYVLNCLLSKIRYDQNRWKYKKIIFEVKFAYKINFILNCLHMLGVSYREQLC